LGAATLVGVAALMKPYQPPPAPARDLTVNVVVQPVRITPELEDTLDLTGVVQPNRVVRVAAEVAGRIERLGQRFRAVAWAGQMIDAGTTLAEGEPVEAGQPILYLNRDLLEARCQRAQAQYEYDEREYRRILELFERGATSTTERDDARTRRDISKAAWDEVTRELERTTILAPISGILNRLPMEVGEYATPGDCVAEIVELDPVKVVVDVPERDVQYLQVGQRGEISPLAAAQDPRIGQITYVNAIADEGTRTTRIEITVDNPGHVLRSGQIVRARLVRRVLRDVIMIPLASVIPLEEGREVYVVNGEQAERREVELGLIKGRSIQVCRGLQEGDLLIVEGHRYVGAGQPVRIVQRLGPTEASIPSSP